MKKLVILLACLCLTVSAAFAEEEVPELNLSETELAAIMPLGEYQQIEIQGAPAYKYWIPTLAMTSVDVSTMEGPFKPAALYTTEDETCSVAVFAMEVAGVDEYATMIGNEGGGSNFGKMKIRDTVCTTYEVADSDMDCLIYPVAEHAILLFCFSPVSGDDDWDAMKSIICATIEPAE